MTDKKYQEGIIKTMVKCGFVAPYGDVEKPSAITKFFWRLYNKLMCFISKKHKEEVRTFLQVVYNQSVRKKPDGNYFKKNKNKPHSNNIRR